MKKVLAYSGLFIVCYLIFVVSILPAHLVLDKITLPKGVSLQGIKGSIWQTHVDKIHIDNVEIMNLQSKLSPLSLLTLSPQVEANFGDAMLPGPEGSLTITLDNQLLLIEDAKILFSASEISSQLKLGDAVTAKGTIDITIEHFTTGQPMCGDLLGEVHWPKARIVAFDESIQVKELKGKLSCDNGAIVLTIDENNDLGLSFNAYMRSAGKLTGDGFLTPGEKFPQNLKPLLSFLPKPDRQGRIKLRL